jgi:Glycosyltransferase family 87
VEARLRELGPPALVAGACALLLGVMGLLTPAFSDYELEAEPSLQALRAGDLATFVELAPAYGGSLVLRAPFALLPNAWGGGDLALFRSMAAPCLVAAAILAVVLWRRGRSLGRSSAACWIALVLVAANPLTLRALEIGHPEELVGGVLCVGAALAAGARRPVLAGALLGLAIANKPWAVLAVVPVLATAETGRVKLLGVTSSAAALVLAPLALGSGAIEEADALARGASTIFQPWQVWWFFGETGHTVIGTFGQAKPDYRVAPEWLSGATHPLVILVPLVVSLVLFARVRRRHWHEGLLLHALVMLLRCLIDPWNVSYYHLPFLLALIAWEIHARRGVPVVSLAVTLLSWMTLVSLPGFAHPDAQALAYLAWSVPLAVVLAARLIAPERVPAPRLDKWPRTGTRSS